MEGGPLARTLVDQGVAGRRWTAGGDGGQGVAADASSAREADEEREAAEDWYVVVDELIDQTAVVHATPWPVLDERSRLRFPQRERGFTARADAARLRALADAGRDTPRALRVGDVFRATYARPSRRTSDEFCDLLDQGGAPSGLRDVSREAREAAKVQYFSAVSAVLDDGEAWALYRELAGDVPED